MNRSSRFSNIPFAYASLEDLQRAFLLQMRRFHKAWNETSAVINMRPTLDKPTKPIQIDKKTDSGLAQLDLMLAQHTLLQNMSDQILTQFIGNPKAQNVKKQVDALIADVDKKRIELRKKLSAEALNSINRNVKAATTKLVKELEDDLGKNSTKIVTTYLIGRIATIGSSEPNLEGEVAYIRIVDLKDETGYIHPTFFIMFGFPRQYKEGVGGEIAGKIFVATSLTFKVPSKIRWVSAVDKPQDARVVVRNELTREGVLGESEHRDIPVEEDKIKFAHENVKSHSVQKGVINVLVKDKTKIKETANDLFVQLRAIIALYNKRSRDILQYKVLRDRGIIQFIFRLPSRLKGRMLSDDGWTRIQRDLSLTPAEVKRMKSALEDHE